MKQKAFFIIFKGLPVAKNYLRPESASLNFDSKDHEVKNNTKEYWDINNSNQTEPDLKNISEYCEHLTADLILNIG